MPRPNDKPQTQQTHPEPYQNDLNPDRLAGQNLGAQSPDADPGFIYAADVKELTRRLQGFTLDELREVPLLRQGTRLQQGKTYVDLRDPRRATFTASGGMLAGPDNWYVPKSNVPFELWNRLVAGSGGRP